MLRNLMLVGGIYHPFEAAGAALATLLKDQQVETRLVEHPDEWLAELQSGEWHMTTVYALRWRMLNHEKYIPHRDEWAYTADPSEFTHLEAFVRGGGRLLGMHTAPICFDTWPGWGDLLGTRWTWDTSWHPPAGRCQVSGADIKFELDDEVYHDLRLASDAEVLLTGLGDDDRPHPIATRRIHGAGRVLCDALGHDAASIEHAAHSQWLASSVAWLLEDLHA